MEVKGRVFFARQPQFLTNFAPHPKISCNTLYNYKLVGRGGGIGRRATLRW